MAMSIEQGYYPDVDDPLGTAEQEHIADPAVVEAYSAASAQSNCYGAGTSEVLNSLFRVVNGIPTVSAEELNRAKDTWSLFLEYFLLGKSD